MKRIIIALVAILATLVTVPVKASGIESNRLWLTNVEMQRYKEFAQREDPSGAWVALINDKVDQGWWLHWTREPLPDSVVQAVTARDLISVTDPVLRAELVHMFTFRVIHLGYQFKQDATLSAKQIAYLAYQVWTAPSKEWWIRTKSAPPVVQPPCSPPPAVQAPPMEPEEPIRPRLSFVPPWTDGLAQSAGSEQPLNSRMIRPGLLDGGLGAIFASAARRPSTTKINQTSNLDSTNTTTVEVQTLIDILNELTQSQTQETGIAMN